MDYYGIKEWVQEYSWVIFTIILLCIMHFAMSSNYIPSSAPSIEEPQVTISCMFGHEGWGTAPMVKNNTIINEYANRCSIEGGAFMVQETI